jgi:uncharacterized protein YcnI
MKPKLIAAASALALVLPPVAQAHVTVHPDEVPAGGFARLDVRVPNERDEAATEKVEMRLPDGFMFVSYEPVPGWDVKVKSERLEQPIEEHGEKITEQAGTVTWTASARNAAIQPGEFRDFGLSVGMPQEADRTLMFPTLQTYDSGHVVRLTGPPEAENPAPQVTLTAADEEHEAETSAEHEGAGAAESDGDGDDVAMGLGVAALVLGGLGLAGSGASLARSRRR